MAASRARVLSQTRSHIPNSRAASDPALRQHPFGAGKGTLAEKGDSYKWLLGGKGANLAEMAAIGLNIPPGFTLTTEVCQQYCSSGVPGEAALAPKVCAREPDYPRPPLPATPSSMGSTPLHVRCHSLQSHPSMSPDCCFTAHRS